MFLSNYRAAKRHSIDVAGCGKKRCFTVAECGLVMYSQPEGTCNYLEFTLTYVATYLRGAAA